jgi:L-asparagine transporter-like permease
MTGSVALRILLFYVVSIALIVTVLPWDRVVAGQSPFAAALSVMDIPAAATVMNLVVLVAVTSCLNSGMYVTSRILFVLAARGDAPRWLIKVNHRRVPVRATLIGSLFGYGALAASVLSPQVVFSFLVNASGATMLIIYLMVCAAQIRQRRRIEAEAPERLQLRMWFFPYASLATVCAIVLVLAAMLRAPDLRNQLLLSVLATLFAALAWVVFRRPRRGAIEGDHGNVRQSG